MTDHPLLEELGQAHAAYRQARLAVANARSDMEIAGVRLLGAERDIATAHASIARTSAWQPIETADPNGPAIVIYVAAYKHLPAFQLITRATEAGDWRWCDIRKTTHWQPEQPPP